MHVAHYKIIIISPDYKCASRWNPPNRMKCSCRNDTDEPLQLGITFQRIYFISLPTTPGHITPHY